MTYQNNLYTGMIKPFQIRRNTPPAWKKEFDIGRSETNKTFTICKVWVRPPNFEFPDISSFISFSNGSGSAFSRIKNGEELRQIAQTLNSYADEVDAMVKSLEPQKTIIDQQLKAYDAQMQIIQQAQQAQKIQSAMNELQNPTEEQPPIESYANDQPIEPEVRQRKRR